MILGAPVDAVTLEEAVARVAAWLSQGGRHQVLTLNPEYLYRAQREKDLLEIAWRANLVTADGVGILWAARQLGQALPGRVTGVDLLLALCQRAAVEGWRVAFLGGKPGVAEEAARRLRRRFPSLDVVATWHGYFGPGEEAGIVEQVRRLHPQLLFVGLGSPRQERWIDRYRWELEVPVLMGVGGSFDVLSGRVRRAPVWLQRAGLEWLWRLLLQPRRLGRILTLPRFAWLVWRSVRERAEERDGA
ncbi:WecB/TagA/CpsF family glycosyltransferase [Desulfothermobacter acidiphilus]|uniref:WecB/TagA/CpsF family glycosyltransferase n=1 Tax=Desulfothermobacter acidiphilus TaxID=1938353 RepID=UPI003F89DF0D